MQGASVRRPERTEARPANRPRPDQRTEARSGLGSEALRPWLARTTSTTIIYESLLISAHARLWCYVAIDHGHLSVSFHRLTLMSEHRSICSNTPGPHMGISTYEATGTYARYGPSAMYLWTDAHEKIPRNLKEKE